MNNFLKAKQDHVNTIEAIARDVSLGVPNLDQKYANFMKNNPKTWMHLMDGKVNVAQLRSMNNVHNVIYERSKGDHNVKKFAADAQLGEAMAQVYLYPKVGASPSKKERREIFEMMRGRVASGEHARSAQGPSANARPLGENPTE